MSRAYLVCIRPEPQIDEAITHRASWRTLVKQLLLLRHAKSDWVDRTLPDHDRPLNDRGRRDAPRVGHFLRDEKILPDLIVTSSARRARETTAAVVKTSGYTGPIEHTRALYGATPGECVLVLGRVSDEYGRVMLVAHNPGIESLAGELTSSVIEMPTATLVHILLPIDQWRDLDENTAGELLTVWRPREHA
jgi:phosphohistidine phosphatase